ncbi:MAG: PLDc N-terminal domain-containing protein [Chloroflexales bacterium]|nr:PLDc N-terminal domain-containing protein [Chloroflexales bacterium]
MQRKRWQDRSAGQRRTIIMGGALQIARFLAAMIDLRRRPPEAVNGSKRLWTAALFVNTIGPLAYFRFGRKMV